MLEFPWLVPHFVYKWCPGNGNSSAPLGFVRSKTARNNAVVGNHSLHRKESYTGTEDRPLLYEEADNRLSLSLSLTHTHTHTQTVSNTTLYAYARRNTQTVTTEHKRSDFIIAELDKTQPIQNRKQ